MIYHSKSFKASAWLLALSLTAGGTVSAQDIIPNPTSVVAAATSTVQQKTPFADVKSGHWAEKHIAKLAFQGIILGNNGQFRPSDNVTREEAIVMAIRFAGLESQIDRNEAVVFPNSFKVDNYYVPYVVLAIEKGLIEQNEQFKLADSEKDSPWGSSKATREWVTKLIVNAIGKSADAKALANSPVSFADSASIGSGYTGYINAAVSLQLVNGVAGNKFDPKGVVNRAMMATLLSRAESKYSIAYEGQSAGILTSLGNGTVGLYTDAGLTTFTASSDTLYARSDSEQLSTESGMVQYAHAYVISKAGKALYVELTDTQPQVETVSGSFVRLVPASQKMYVWIGDEPVEIKYDDTLQVLDESGNKLELSALTTDASVKVTRDTFRKTPLAISVQIVNAPVNKSGKGTVQSVGASALTITNDAGKSETWNVAADAVLVTGNTLLKSLNELKQGDSITYVVKNGVITRVEVSASASRTESGVYYSSDAKTITYMKDNKYVTKPITDLTIVNIQGLPTALLTDLKSGDLVELKINDADQVTSVTVTNRKVELAAGVEIRNYDAKYKALSVVDSTGTLKTLMFNASSTIDFNGVPFTLDGAVAAGLFTQGRKVTVSYTGDTIVKLQLTYRYSGTVVSVNPTTSKLTLSVGSGNLLTLTMLSPVVEVYGKSSAVLSDVLVGDTVTATMNQDQDKVVGIYVQRTQQLKVAAVNTSTYRVTLRAQDGTLAEYSLYSLELLDETGNKISGGNLAVGNVVNVTFSGKSPVSLQRVPVTAGAVRGIDANQVIIEDYSGRTTALPLGTGYSIVRGGAVSTSYTSLVVGDRAEVRKDTKGNVLITVFATENKKFWKYDSSTNTLQTKRASVSDENYKFSLAGVALTSNGKTIAPQSLTDGDALIFYTYDGKLVEIEKR
ncbi:S-layer domain protein [Paenibacillus curdlanolyticus YK9]|uniref:S-layer domain protein n=1 Tax=Paenibacillus curdlanolyticus YK9 TaxID=717606 RepID=E0IC18_9BACL|nr:S-layer homology domain-containing protein [Paenibacillus curdlanolyticus]EFM09704.1 S-layer domain protein [Paenibacillus curdlanolyticus YK9]